MTMTKTERSERAQKTGDGAKNRGNGKSQNLKSTRRSKAILKIKRARRSEHTIKATFKDTEGNDVKEYIHAFRDGNPPELLIEFEKQLLKLGDRYDLFENERWKILCQLGGRALEGRSEKYWTDIVEGVRTHNSGDSDVQRKRFKKLIQKVNSKYLGKDAIEEQRDAMEYGDLTYDSYDHASVVE